MFCTKCGTKNPDGSRFCGNCGNALSAPAAVATNSADSVQSSPAPRRLYMDAKGLTLFNYKFEIRNEQGVVRYLAETVSESMIRYNARLYHSNGMEAAGIHQQKKMTMVAMNFDIVAPNGALITQVLQEVKLASVKFDLPELGITLNGDFFALNFQFVRNGQIVGVVKKKLMAWGDCYEIEYTDLSLEQALLSTVMAVQLCIAASRNRRRRR